jgi:crotonobetainyl-CoA:carnitine CoA-transferase CaiB-like acyl-CoA transferase
MRVLDLGDTTTDTIGRLLADLGADVLRIEPPGGAAARRATPTVSGAGVEFTLNNANKRSAVLDPAIPADATRLLELAETADLVIDGGGVAAFGTTSRDLADRIPRLVVLAVSDFGATGPRAHWRATDAVLCAMSTALSRSGPTTGRPVLPPQGIASTTAAVQATWAALVAVYHRMRSGTGDYIDYSRFEGVVQALDPPFGSEGQAAVGLKQSHELWRGRPRNQQIYPTFPCRDGFVRMCLLSARQWKGMFGWLGEPERFSDPALETIAARYAASAELNSAFAELFADGAMADLVAEGQRRGVPMAAVYTPAEALASEHFQSVGALTDVEIGTARLTVPTGPFVLDGRHTGIVRECTADEARWVATERTADGDDATDRPFAGLRILDLGVIVAGGELGRLFADLGADVVKVESAAYPDGLRQTPPGKAMSRSWALTHRNESSLGLDLRDPAGKEIFARLASESDAVFANFKPGTLASLGFSYDDLKRLNPRIVLAESSAFGATGPWSAQMGYGPLVRATTGVSRLWSSADPADTGFYDATTIFPDHVAARITAIAALAALIGSDTGAHVHISQAEVAVNTLATAFVTETALAAGLPVDTGDDHDGVYPCQGDDEWCVISLRSTADRAALAEVLGLDRLPAESDALRDTITAWTASRTNTTVAETLQDRAIAAAPMNRAVDVLADPQLLHRNVFADMAHPLFDATMHTEQRAAPSRTIPDAALRPAPMPGEHTREVCRARLSMTDADIDDLIDRGVLFAWQPGES